MPRRKCGYNPQVRPFIFISLDIPATKNRSYKFSRPNTLAFCLAIRQYLITLFGRYDKRIVIPGKDSTINVYIPIFEWCTNRFNLTPDTLFNGRQYHPRDRICKVTLHALLLHEIALFQGRGRGGCRRRGGANCRFSGGRRRAAPGISTWLPAIPPRRRTARLRPW